MTDEVQRSLGRLESKVDILVNRGEVYEKRLNSIEKKVWWASGASAVIAYIATNFLGKH